MYKSIVLFMFFPHKINKDFIKNKICIRNIIFVLFVVYFISLSIIFNNHFGNINMGVNIIFSIVCFIFEMCFIGIIDALILHIFDKKLMNRNLKFKTCYKLIIPKIITNAFVMFIQSVLVLIGLQISKAFSLILATLTFGYFIVLFSYYLRNVYNCQDRHIVLLDIVYSILIIAPIIALNLIK